jgi:hypothetical protein
MKRALQYQPPRQSVIYAYTRRMLDETATNANTFAMELAERYVATVAADVRNVPFRLGEGDELLKAMKNNGQILRRFMSGDVKVLPADLEDAWVLALPQPYRRECERDLARRRGQWTCAELPDSEAGQAACLARLASEFGQLMEALAPALGDGRIDAKDLPHARRILNESDDLISAVINVRRQLHDLLPDGPV